MNKIILGTAAICVASLLTGPVESNAQVYEDKDDWVAAVGNYSTEDFEDEAIGTSTSLSYGISVDTVEGSVQDGDNLPFPGIWLGTVHNTTQVWFDQLNASSYYGPQETAFTFAEEICGFGGNWHNLARKSSQTSGRWLYFSQQSLLVWQSSSIKK